MIIPANYAQANFQMTGTACPTGAECTLGLDMTVNTGDPVTIAQFLYEQWVADICAIQSQEVTLANVHVKFGPEATGPAADFGGSSTGENTASGCQPQVAMLVQKLTNQGGRAGRGRLFMPGLVEADVNQSGLIDSGVLATAIGAWEAFRAALDAIDIGPVVFHGAGSPLTTPTFIDTLLPVAQVATQRQRNRR